MTRQRKNKRIKKALLAFETQGPVLVQVQMNLTLNEIRFP